MNQSHERMTAREEVKVGSNRSFGIVFAVVFTVIALFPLWGGGSVRLWALAIAAVFLATAFLVPNLLGPLNQIWFRFGMLLHRVVNPIILGIMFFGIITPAALIARLFGAKFLALRFEDDISSYWKVRLPAEPDPASYKNQF